MPPTWYWNHRLNLPSDPGLQWEVSLRCTKAPWLQLFYHQTGGKNQNHKTKARNLCFRALQTKRADEVWRWCQEKSKLGDIFIDPYNVAWHLVDWRPKFESWRDGSETVKAPRNPRVCFSSFYHFPNITLVSKHTHVPNSFLPTMTLREHYSIWIVFYFTTCSLFFKRRPKHWLTNPSKACWWRSFCFTEWQKDGRGVLITWT